MSQAPDFAQLWASSHEGAKTPSEWPAVMFYLLDKEVLRKGVTGRPSREIGLAELNALAWGSKPDWCEVPTEGPTPSTQKLTAEILGTFPDSYLENG